MQKTLQSVLRGSCCRYGNIRGSCHQALSARISNPLSPRGISSQQKQGNHYAIQAKRKDSIALDESLFHVCGSREAARNELRWLREGAEETIPPPDPEQWPGETMEARRINRESEIELLTKTWIDRRAKGEPLQYILGTDFFGDIKLICRAGALIPRWETASIVTYLAKLLTDSFERITDKSQIPTTLRVLDLCTGSGCIPLQFQHAFHDGRNPITTLQMLGIDAYETPLALANDNRDYVQRAEQQAQKDRPRNKIESETDARTRTPESQASNMRLRSLHQLRFRRADVLAPSDHESLRRKALSTILQADFGPDASVDVLVCNPPYISPRDYTTVTEKSVRDWEPKNALVPWKDLSLTPTSESKYIPIEDTFYPRLLQIADEVRAKVIMFEVADVVQARRVDEYTRSMGWTGLRRIWKDCPESGGAVEYEVDVRRVVEQGIGNGRAVFAARGEGLTWLDGLLPKPKRREDLPEEA